jgi:hypothetical protein
MKKSVAQNAGVKILRLWATIIYAGCAGIIGESV